MQPNTYPPILPAPAPAAPVGENPSASKARSKANKDIAARKRIGTQLACEECRARKTRCNGARPMCAHCVKRGLPTCVYRDRTVTVLQVSSQVLDLLMSLPEDRSVKLLYFLRDKQDPTSALSSFNLDTDDTDGEEDLATPESTPGSLESELREHNSTAYMSLRPINNSELARSHLLRPFRDHALVGEDVLMDGSTDVNSMPDYEGQSQAGDNAADGSGGVRLDADSAIRQFRAPLSPPSEVPYCDERLHHLNVAAWTDIQISNDFAARVISLYITTDHPLLGLFSPSLFITDLVNQQGRYCSRFLFHAVMYLGCLMYSAFDQSAARTAESFCAKAEEMWAQEKEGDSYNAMAGAVLLSLSYVGQGKDHEIIIFTKAALSMGIRLGLFGNLETAARGPGETLSEEDVTASCYAAWGVFNWNVLVSLFYRQPGTECPPRPPILPIPEGAIAQQGIVPRDVHEVDEALVGNTFPALCRFWLIIHGARWIYYPGKSIPDSNFQMALAEHKFRELIAWAQNLPPSLLRREGSPHYVAVIHIWFHSVILDIFRPFIGRPSDLRPRMGTFSAVDSTPDTAYTASTNQLKHLIVEYRTNHAASTYTILWHTGLIYLANAMLHNTKDPEWRLYFLLCIYGYESLSRPYRVSEVIVQGLLSMTLRDTNMSVDDARQIMAELKENRLDNVKKDMEEQVRATFMGDLDLAFTDPEQAKVETLAGEFDNLALFQDFINQDKMSD
ncbi:Uu.00g097440.m01.CDS01 [Anthostomella pinea]|uniref:Uu.00g097440.m01.CDS01 n=1 Tax=Anthostomella pinea TaxID=933095 RepID=A0AAI8YF10_9PEZI|nr:Uu.00g097440.m01.CDS01 [Anthostomella pinea]